MFSQLDQIAHDVGVPANFGRFDDRFVHRENASNKTKKARHSLFFVVSEMQISPEEFRIRVLNLENVLHVHEVHCADVVVDGVGRGGERENGKD